MPRFLLRRNDIGLGMQAQACRNEFAVMRTETEEEMFGTIAHATLKPGAEKKLDGMMEDWKRDIRPKIPGTFVELIGHKAGEPDQVVFVALAQDEATYRKLAELPEQHQFYLRFDEVFEGPPAWEDVEMAWGARD